MSSQIVVYSTYTVVAVGLVTWLARTLGHHGGQFLTDVFPDQPTLAKSINQLLVTGFFMLNLGYAAYLMESKHAETGTEGFEVLAGKLGALLISLAVIHFLNLVVFWKIRRHRMMADMAPPVAPAMALPNTNTNNAAYAYAPNPASPSTPAYNANYPSAYATPMPASSPYATATDFSAGT